MTFKDLVNIVGGREATKAEGPPYISGIGVDSRIIKEGEVFFAIPGLKLDGSKFIGHARSNGAACAVSENLPNGQGDFPVVIVEDAMSALSDLSATFYGDPSSRMKVAGITGTNGKTTVTYILEAIAMAAGEIPGVIGTIDYRGGGKILGCGLTTPYPHELQHAMSRIEGVGAGYLFMEVSSHGAAQGRIRGIDFDVGLFTNLSRDHLDFHGTMDGYFQAKKDFFTGVLFGGKENGRVAVVNGDCPYGRRLLKELSGSVITYGTGEAEDVTVKDPLFSIQGISARIKTPEWDCEVKSKLIGFHNLENIVASAACAYALGFSGGDVAKGLGSLGSIPGRLERVETAGGKHLFVDYAHTPGGLKNVLVSLTPYKKGRLIVVFGCGGDRDRGKRAPMGEVACTHADISVVTSDNPRTEEPLSIIEDILPGCHKAGASRTEGGERKKKEGRKYMVEPDRKRAIFAALEEADDGDIVVIAGKGHETYQIVGEKLLDFDDREVARSFREG